MAYNKQLSFMEISEHAINLAIGNSSIMILPMIHVFAILCFSYDSANGLLKCVVITV